MVNDESHPSVIGCTFINNRSNGNSGGMHNWRSNPTVTNCLFDRNVAVADGGGMFNLNGSSPTLSNCTFSGNSAGAGGGIFSYDSNPTLANCILWGGGDEIWANEGSTVTITFSDVQGGWTNEDCPKDHPVCNIDADPLFVPGPGGCHYLSLDSPCVDSGSDSAESLELDSTATRRDEVPDAGVVDLGYHYPVTGQLLVMGDYDRDGNVNLADFAGFQNCFTDEGPTALSPCCRIFDFQPDNDVDREDYAFFESVFHP